MLRYPLQMDVSQHLDARLTRLSSGVCTKSSSCGLTPGIRPHVVTVFGKVLRFERESLGLFKRQELLRPVFRDPRPCRVVVTNAPALELFEGHRPVDVALRCVEHNHRCVLPDRPLVLLLREDVADDWNGLGL